MCSGLLTYDSVQYQQISVQLNYKLNHSNWFLLGSQGPTFLGAYGVTAQYTLGSTA